MQSKKKCDDGDFDVVDGNGKKNGEGMKDEIGEEDAKDEISNVNKKTDEREECVKCEKVNDVVKDRSEE